MNNAANMNFSAMTENDSRSYSVHPQLNNMSHQYMKPKLRTPQRPDVIETDPMVMQIMAPPPPQRQEDSSVLGHTTAEPAEHYDLENASSIAPSDIDVVYHYKGYRNGNRHRYNSGGKPLGKRKPQKHNTPLARLSPYSEVSHNTPRIVNLGDLSGKGLPPGLLAEQSERSLNSPVSHVSSASRHSHIPLPNRGLTSENVARFNQRATPQTSTLLDTVDLLSAGGADKDKKSMMMFEQNNSSRLERDSTSSSDRSDENDSFTCSEFEYDQVQDRKDTSDSNVREMIFNRLVSPNSRLDTSKTGSSDEDVQGGALPEANGTTWENLLSWTPDFVTFSGVFRDIAELPHSPATSDEVDACRPSPLGDRTEEEYI